MRDLVRPPLGRLGNVITLPVKFPTRSMAPAHRISAPPLWLLIYSARARTHAHTHTMHVMTVITTITKSRSITSMKQTKTIYMLCKDNQYPCSYSVKISTCPIGFRSTDTCRTEIRLESMIFDSSWPGCSVVMRYATHFFPVSTESTHT